MKTAAPTVITIAIPNEQVEEIARRVAELLAERDTDKPVLLDRRGMARALLCSTATLDAMRQEEGFPEVRLLDAPRFELPLVLDWLRRRPIEKR